MGFPVPGNAIEPSLDLSRHLITNPCHDCLTPVFPLP
jgi:hypothetical protein